jgi:hypothetical protein
MHMGTKQTYVFLLMAFCATTLFAQPWPHVLWDRSGSGDSSSYGYNIFSLGSQNADQYADWGVFAFGRAGTDDDSAYIELFHGDNPPSNQPYAAVHQTSGVRNIRQAESAGDVNGDGYIDWFWVGIYGYPPSSGIVHVLFGGPNADTVADVEIPILLGGWTSAIDDFNGDGFDDLYVYEQDERFGYAYWGGNPMDSIPDWTKHDFGQFTQDALPWAAGDLNGDGYSDFGSTTLYHTTYIYLGAQNPDTLPGYVWENSNLYPNAIVSDLNGDSINDLVSIFMPGPAVMFGRSTLVPLRDVEVEFPCIEGIPYSAAGIGDINGDGYGDFALIRVNCGYFGTLAVYLGHPWINPQPAWAITGSTEPLNLLGLYTAAALGDVNGDGIDDLGIGATDVSGPGFLRRGRAVVIAGDTGLVVGIGNIPSGIPHDMSVEVYPNPFNSTTRLTFTVPRAGQVNMSLYNLAGQRVINVLEGNFAPGEHAVVLNGEGLASGIYFVRVEAGEMRAVTKVVVLR